MNKREFLRSLGYTVGERGRFSAEMLAALDEAPAGSYTEDVKPAPKARAPKPAVTPGPTPAVMPQVKVVQPLPDKPVLRDQQTLYAVSPAGRTHVRIGYDSCFSCNYSVSRCDCASGPRPPAGAIPVKSYADTQRL